MRYTGYTYLAVPRAAFIVPVTDAGEVVLVGKYRHPVRDWTLEIPAGSVDDGEFDLDENVAVVRMPLAQALARARARRFREGQTALAILLAAPHLNRICRP